jgi:hypothetical protein
MVGCGVANAHTQGASLPPGGLSILTTRLAIFDTDLCLKVSSVPVPGANPAGLVAGSRSVVPGLQGGDDHRFAGDDRFASRRDARTQPSE